MPLPKRVSLGLGAGGARGYAHIGAIRAIEARGIEITGVAGSSMGALVGGIYAAGQLESFADWAVGLTQREVLQLLDVSLTAPGVIRAERVLARVRELTGDVRIEALPVPFTAVATDLLAAREVWFQRGPLDTAIRASIALPGIFTPVMLNGRLLADGGLMDPVPVAPTAAVAADATIAIELAGERTGASGATPVKETAEPRPLDEWIGRFRHAAAQIMDSEQIQALHARGASGEAQPEESASEASSLDDFPAGLTRFDVMNQSLEAMQRLVTRYRLAAFHPDHLITIPRDACRTMEFHRAAELIELGRTKTDLLLDELESEPA
jgi:NTE family protein